jgi:hypothetical protein
MLDFQTRFSMTSDEIVETPVTSINVQEANIDLEMIIGGTTPYVSNQFCET